MADNFIYLGLELKIHKTIETRTFL